MERRLSDGVFRYVVRLGVCFINLFKNGSGSKLQLEPSK